MIAIASLLFLVLIGLTVILVLINCLMWLFIILVGSETFTKRWWVILLALLFSGGSVILLVWLWPIVMSMFN